MSRRVALVALLAAAAACSAVSTVRIQPEHIATPPGTRPIAIVQANATTLNLLFLKVPGGVSLDRVVNQLLVVEAKNLGADKVVLTSAHLDPEQGVWFLWRLLGWQSAEAVGIAVAIDGPPADPRRFEGPEAPIGGPVTSAVTSPTPAVPIPAR